MIRFQTGNSLLANWITFNQTKYVLERLVDKIFATTPVTNEEYKVLLAVKNHPGPASQVDIARWLNRSPNTISVLLGRMEEKGLLSRTRDTGDHRVIQVALTPKGEQLYWKTSVVAWDLVSKVMGGLTEAERKVLVRLLHKVQKRASGLLGNGRHSPEVVALDDWEQMALLEEYIRKGTVDPGPRQAIGQVSSEVEREAASTCEGDSRG